MDESTHIPALVAVGFALLIAAGCAASSQGKTRPPTGIPIDSRFAATATVLANGQVLIAGGVASENSSSVVAELYDPATVGFNRTGSLSTGRAYHTATLLKDGRVLIAGGLGANGHPVGTSELYDPATGAFTTTGTMIEARYDCTASLLPNSRVLIAGGDTTSAVSSNIDTAELYDPATATFSATGNITRYYDPSIDKIFYEGEMIAARARHSATVLQDGNVLIAGGEDAHGAVQATAEIYEPASGKFLKTGSMNFARREHRATLLPNGDVLITGGVDNQGQVLQTAELYRPATRKFILTTAAFPAGGTDMNEGRTQHAAALLASGLVLIAGGSGAEAISRSAELYDPARGAFTCVGGRDGAVGTPCTASMAEYRSSAMDVLLPNGEVLIAGGYNFHAGLAHNMPAAQDATGGASVPFGVLWSAEVYDPASGTFVSTVAIAHAHFAGASR